MRVRDLPAVIALALALPAARAGAAEPPPSLEAMSAQVRELAAAQESLDHRLDQLAKAIDDVAWFQRLGDIAEVDKWRIYGPPRANPKNPQAPGATNPVKFYTYTFVPRAREAGEKLPLLVLPHGGVHADFDTYWAHIVRELVTQGYVVLAPEYRGSTGYGREHWELIDYGGREVDDVHAAKDWALESFDFLDSHRVGLAGWSHGGLIVLLEAFAHPKDYGCVFAGVPVSDLIARLGYEDKEYQDLFSAEYHIGKTVREDIGEYRRRSPAYQAEELAIPLLIHTNTNDEDVNVLEVEHLINALKAAGKKFDSKVYQDAPGGHSFDRLDTPFARAARTEIYAFLARYLHPPRPPK